jgi:hypothetical protein
VLIPVLPLAGVSEDDFGSRIRGNQYSTIEPERLRLEVIDRFELFNKAIALPKA